MKSFLKLLALLPAVFASPIEVRQSGDLLSNKWIVKLRDGASESVLQSTIASVSDILGNEPTQTYSFGSFKGFAINGLGDVTSLLANVANIERIEQDSIVRANALTTQQDSTYGLARISHRKKGANNYIYDDSAGQGTYAYIIDTGIYTQHNDFGGRATFGKNFADDGKDTDCNGHGTHVSGTTGGTTYGVAKKTNLIAVKVLGCDGSGSNSGVLAGIAYAVNDAKSKGRISKSVANLSLGGIFSPTTNAAVREAVNQGLFLSVAAGNSGAPTITASPASEPKVCTIGAIDSNDQRASFSNFGLLVDLFGPGVDVKSDWIDGPDDTNTISGTSMATPHITGLGAYLLGLGKGGNGGEGLCTTIKDMATKNAVGLALSPNRIGYNGNGA